MLASFRSLCDLAKAAIVAAAFLVPTVTAAHAEDVVTVFAAASLKEVLGEVSEAWKAETGRETTLSFAGSSALAKQIEQGAPVDLFISADLKWMDYLDQAGRGVG
ncbi:MAG: molybdate ABC transporter substrate-binding protein, partial [Rhizobium sp.]|nr:molybdate ABC transporter substrate-binding protein [Rhizobium sp.]